MVCERNAQFHLTTVKMTTKTAENQLGSSGEPFDPNYIEIFLDPCSLPTK